MTSNLSDGNSDGKKAEVASFEEKYRDISFLCRHYDPYTNDQPNEKIEELLLKYQLTEKAHDPFQITKELLIILDELQQRTNPTKQ